MNEKIKIFAEGVSVFTSDTDLKIQTNKYTRGKYFLDLVLEFLPKGANILDYGCGPGRISKLLGNKGFLVTGVDPVQGYIDECKTISGEMPNLNFIVLDEFNRDSSNFDCIICSSVIEFVDNPEELLFDFYRLLRPNGVLIISFANNQSLIRKYAKLRRGKVFPRADFQKLWDIVGFLELVQSSGFVKCSEPKFFEPDLLNSRHVGTLGVLAFKKNA
jgi:2-polyprenyl-3-methyl-5-hydroxy-6-metoxy-1,4-benzoquinol methylase